MERLLAHAELSEKLGQNTVNLENRQVNRYEYECHWPLEEWRKHDLYFYNEALEAYGSGGAVVTNHGQMILLGSYSYLGLNQDPRVNQAAREAIEHYGTGTHGVSLLTGSLKIHKQLEQRIAQFKGTEDAVLFSSGYAANLSSIAALIGPGDVAICDKLVHASIVDGVVLSGAQLRRFAHNDIDSLRRCMSRTAEFKRRLVIVDAVYSMEGSIAGLPPMIDLAREYGALTMIDEAHALGVLGRSGKGIEEHFDIPADAIDFKMGTLSKSIPSIGGYLATKRRICEYLRFAARGFVYSAALPAPCAAAAIKAFDILESNEGQVAKLQENALVFRGLLDSKGLNYLDSKSAVFPIICGSVEKALRLARYCHKRGIFLQCIAPPVVPQNTARLRAAMHVGLSLEQIEYCAEVLARGAKALGISSA